MRTSLVIAALLVTAISSPQCAAAQAPATNDLFRHDYALLIGVSAYTDSRWPRLDDIKLQIEQLKTGLAPHFTHDIEVLTSPSFDELETGLRTFLRSHGKDAKARLFIYYSGHGYTKADLVRDQYRGYITGADTPFVDGSTAGYAAADEKALSMDLLVAMVKDISALQVLFVLDSCFSGTVFAVRSPSADKLTSSDIAPLVASPVREFITAGNEKEKIPALSPIPRLLLNAIAGDADYYHAGFVTAQQIQLYLWAETRKSGIGITPQFGKLPGGVFDRGECVFRVFNSDNHSPTLDGQARKKSGVFARSRYAAAASEVVCPTRGTDRSFGDITTRGTNIHLVSCVTTWHLITNDGREPLVAYDYSYAVENRGRDDVYVSWDPAGISGWVLGSDSLISRRPSLQPPDDRLTQIRFGNIGEIATLKMIVPKAVNNEPGAPDVPPTGLSK